MADERAISHRLMEQALAEAEGNPMIFGERLLALVGAAARDVEPAYSDDAEPRWRDDPTIEPDTERYRFADGSSFVLR